MNINRFEQIEDYLNGDLSSEEKLLFESELALNEELSSALNIYRTIETDMRGYEKESKKKILLEASLQKLTAKYFNTSQSQDIYSIKKFSLTELKHQKDGKYGGVERKIETWKTIAVAASVAALIAIGITWNLNNMKDSREVAVIKNTDSLKNLIKEDTVPLQPVVPSENIPAQESEIEIVKEKKKIRIDESRRQQLYAYNFKPDAAPENEEGPLEDAFASYKKGDYKNAITAIENADLNEMTRGEEADPKLTEFYAHYYKGLSYMADSSTTKAIPELESAVGNSPDSLNQIKAQWYLALAYLEKNDIVKSKKLLQQIAENKAETEYQLKAEALLIELN